MIMTIRKVLSLSGSPPGGTREEAEIKKTIAIKPKRYYFPSNLFNHRFGMSIITLILYRSGYG